MCILSYFTMGRPLPLPKIAPSRGDIRTPIEYMVTVAHPTPHAKRHLDRSSRFCMVPRRDIPDRQTDRPTTETSVEATSICYTYTMRPKKVKNNVNICS